MRVDWIETNIDSLLTNECIFIDGDWVESKDQNPDGEVRLIQLADIGDGKFKNKSDRFMTKLKSEELKCTYLKKNDILIARMPDPLGRACLFPFEKEEAFVTVVDVAIVRLNDKFTSIKYVLNMINTPHFRNEIDKLKSGSTRKRISRKNLATLKFPLAPFLEQKAIVAKIEQLFSELDQAQANLKTAQAKLKIYRQAVLKKAFEGELTKEWREKQTNLPTADELLEQIKKEREIHYKQQLEEWKQSVKNGIKQTKPKKQKELNIEPNKITLGSLIEEVKYGTSKKCDYGTDGTGVLRIPNIADGYIDNTDLKFAKFSNEEITQYKLKTGDILIIRSNGSVKLVGKPALINENDTKYLYAGYLIRLRPYQTILNSKYLYYQIISHELRKQIEEKAKSTSGVNNINSGEIESLLLSIQSLEEQNQIVQEIESRLSVCDKIEETIETTLAKSEALRQSILKKAFEGKLLSEQELENIKNHPEYETAEELLKRIKKERNK
jgi:type I restriction enzyme S subunit